MWPDFTGGRYFHTAVCVAFISLLRGKRGSFRFVRQRLLSCSEALTTSLGLHPEGLALQRHAGQTAVLQALTLGYLGLKRLLDNRNNFWLSIMSTNRCSPSVSPTGLKQATDSRNTYKHVLLILNSFSCILSVASTQIGMCLSVQTWFLLLTDSKHHRTTVQRTDFTPVHSITSAESRCWTCEWQLPIKVEWRHKWLQTIISAI